MSYSSTDFMEISKSFSLAGKRAVITGGVPRFVGRSRNTPETCRRAKVAQSRVPQLFSGEA